MYSEGTILRVCGKEGTVIRHNGELHVRKNHEPQKGLLLSIRGVNELNKLSGGIVVEVVGEQQ